jgi:hypothetical protein
MDVIAHQTPAKDCHLGFLLIFLKDIEEMYTIFVIMEDILSIRPTPNDMVDATCAFLTGSSRHAIQPLSVG